MNAVLRAEIAVANAPRAIAWIDEAREEVDTYLERLLADRYPTGYDALEELGETARYAVLGSGKRLRPILTLAVADLYRPRDDESLALACATELIHAATLALDDLPCMDDARLRRGKPSAHAVFGESTTILAALGLWSEGARLVASVRSVPVNEMMGELAESVGRSGLVGGQFLDLQSFGKPQTLAEVEDLSFRKTGALLALAVRLGALLGEVPPTERAALERFGRAFGGLYQVRDDLIDALSTAEDAGKDVRIDEKNGRATFVTVLGEAGARGRLAESAAEARAALALIPRDTRRLDELLTSIETV